MLTQSQRDALAREGYAVVSALVPDPLIHAARDAVCSFVDADLAQPDTWYRHEPLVWSVVPVHHAQAFWDIRQLPTLYEVFASLWGTEKLWVSMDRAVFKVPRSRAHPTRVDESVVHWDMDPPVPASCLYQAMLFLTDAPPGQGAFGCVPSIFRELERYLAAHRGPILDVPVDLTGHEYVEVPARTGDLVIWNARLPHHGGPNRGRAPRVSQAVTMFPEGTSAEREERVTCWRQNRAPSWWRGWKGQMDPEVGEPAALTTLGRRLVGLDPWP